MRPAEDGENTISPPSGNRASRRTVAPPPAPTPTTMPGSIESPDAPRGSPAPRSTGDPPRLVILGASARGWAASAARAGVRVHAADLFADRDLASIAEAVAIPFDAYPAALASVADRFPPAPWCYTGALENHPELIDSLAARRPLAGNPGSVLGRARSWSTLSAALGDAGLRFPATRSTPVGVPLDGSWLRKPLASAAGRGIVGWRPGVAGASGGCCWQEWIPGEPVAAAYVIDDAGARLVGVSRQFVGREAWGAAPFAWCGSSDVAPESLPDRRQDRWRRIGAVLWRDLGLRGAIGVDAIATADGDLVVVEVNPRPTASMELIERRCGLSLAAEHLRAHGIDVDFAPAQPGSGATWAKGILRVGRALDVSAELSDRLDELSASWSDGSGWPAIADLPRPGTTIPAGAPLVTVFAGDAGDPCPRLDARMEALRGVVGG